MDDEPKSNTIFIANLNPNITKDDVKAVFRRFGKIVSIDLIRKRPENVYAFIEFDDMRDAVDAVMQYICLGFRANMTDLRGKRLRIEYRNGGYNEKRQTPYEAAKENPLHLHASNSSAAEAPTTRMEAEQEPLPVKAVEAPTQKEKPAVVQEVPPKQTVEACAPREKLDFQEGTTNIDLLTVVNDLRKTVRELESRVEVLERERGVSRDLRYNNNKR